MLLPTPRGTTLLETLLALVLLSWIALATGPLAVRTMRLLHQGRFLAEAVALGAHRQSLLQTTPFPTCGTPFSGVDSGRLARIDWIATPGAGAFDLTLILRDAAGAFPAETLMASVPCHP